MTIVALAVMDLKTLTVLSVLIMQNVTVLEHVSATVNGLASDVDSGLDSVRRTVLDVQVPCQPTV